MSDASVSATELTSQYLAQVTSDLEHNTKERERISAEITALQEQFTALQHDFAVLQNMRQALEGTSVLTEPQAGATGDTQVEGSASEETPAAAEAVVVPAPRKAGGRKPRATTGAGTGSAAGGGKRTRAKSAKAPAKAPAKLPAAPRGGAKKKTAAAAAKKSTAKTSPAPSGAPKLVELVRQYLTEQKEPRSAAEIAEALGKAYPQRSVKTTVVRTTLESLVARNQAQRTKQGNSVFYTAPEASQTSAGAPAPADEKEAAAAQQES